MRFKLSYLNLINPFYYIGREKTKKIEKEVWGNLERGGGSDRTGGCTY